MPPSKKSCSKKAIKSRNGGSNKPSNAKGNKTLKKNKRPLDSRGKSKGQSENDKILPENNGLETITTQLSTTPYYENKENINFFDENEVTSTKKEIYSSDHKISTPLKDSNISNINSNNIYLNNEFETPLIGNYYYENHYQQKVYNSETPPATGEECEHEIYEESTEDEFEFILEQELIKEQIKRNVRMSVADEYINSLVDVKNGCTTLEQQEKLILNAIRANRKLAQICVTLEALLVKKLDKITKEVKYLKVNTTNSSEEGETMISRGFYSQFGAPYFKDTSGFYCPRNKDFYDKMSKNQFIGYLYMQADHTADITALSNAIREYIIDDFVKKSNLENLKKRFTEIDNLVQHEVLRKELTFINNKINFMKAVDLKYLVKDISDSDIDWMKISSKEALDILTPGECLRYWNLILSPKVNRGAWTQQEKKELKKLAIQFQYQNWDRITELLNTKRTGYQCFIQFKKNFGMVDFNRGRWSKKEDVQLSYLVSISEQGGVIGWAKVLCHLEDRTMAQALNRWYRLDPGLKKGKFTDEEDIILVNAVEQFGLDFQKVASVFPNRSAIQLRERYFAKRDMKINKCGEWSLAEDKLLMDLIAIHGERKWSKIAQNFPSRNRIQIRHRYKCIKLNLQKDPEFKLENLNRFKRNTHVNAKNKRDDEAISKSTAIDIISKTIEEGKIFYNKRRILKRTGRMKEKG